MRVYLLTYNGKVVGEGFGKADAISQRAIIARRLGVAANAIKLERE